MQTDTEALLARLDRRVQLDNEIAGAVATIREQAARIDRTMSDHGRMLWQDDVAGICASPDLCFDHGGSARCGPCANKQAIAHGIAPDLNPSYLPEVCRLNRELKAARADADRMAEALEPFARCCDQISEDEPGTEWAKFRIEVQNYRAARQAIATYAAHPKEEADG